MSEMDESVLMEKVKFWPSRVVMLKAPEARPSPPARLLARVELREARTLRPVMAAAVVEASRPRSVRAVELERAVVLKSSAPVVVSLRTRDWPSEETVRVTLPSV